MEVIFVKIVLILLPLIAAVTVHEYCHVAMAKWLGDDTGQRLGRFSLDPLRHIDPIWTVALPAALIAMSTLSGGGSIPFIAAGKPAPYNPTKLKRRFFGKPLKVKTAELLVALAGPASNLVLAFLSMGVVGILLHAGYTELTEFSAVNVLMQFAYLNAALFVFNLIPVGPLDGTKVLLAFLPYQAAQKYEQVSNQLSWVLLAVLIMGGGAIIGRLVHAVISGITWLLIY